LGPDCLDLAVTNIMDSSVTTSGSIQRLPVGHVGWGSRR
jgi:hypothetical protein